MDSLGTAAREGVVLREANGWGTLVVTGPDRRRWLNGLITSDVASLGPNGGAWGLLLNRLGKIQSELWTIDAPERLLVATAPGTLERVHTELDRMLIMEDAELEPLAETTWLTLHGPRAVAQATALSAQHGGDFGALDWTGLGGAALSVPSTALTAIRSEHADVLLDDEAWRRLRLERALPELGVDFGDQDRPHEAALERRAVSWSKGCYLGQEVVCMQDMRGKVKRSVRVLAVEAAPDVAWAEPLTLLDAEGRAAGTPTSRAYSARASAWLFMAQLRLDAADGALWLRSGDDARREARLAPLF